MLSQAEAGLDLYAENICAVRGPGICLVRYGTHMEIPVKKEDVFIRGPQKQERICLRAPWGSTRVRRQRSGESWTRAFTVVSIGRHGEAGEAVLRLADWNDSRGLWDMEVALLVWHMALG